MPSLRPVGRRIYLDNHATTPCDPRVVEAMLPYFTEKFGNAASRNHSFGKEASQAVETARGQLASLIGAEPGEIVFTSGATESDNLAIMGALEANMARGNHIISVVTEHKAVLETCRHLEREGKALITYLPVDRDGLIDLGDLRAAITDQTVLVSVMTANNEIGVLQPMEEIGCLCAERGVLFHTDAAQALGKVNIDVQAMNIHLASFSGHKVYGPKGVGALYVRKRNPRARLRPMIHGGGHENGLRSGTLNVPAVVGFGVASEIAAREMPSEVVRIAGLRDRLWAKLSSRIDRLVLNGHPTRRLPGNLSVRFLGVDDESLLLRLDGIAVSAGSACTSATVQPSHVLRAIGVPQDSLYSTLRFGIGRFNTEPEIFSACELVERAVLDLRSLAASLSS